MNNDPSTNKEETPGTQTGHTDTKDENARLAERRRLVRMASVVLVVLCTVFLAVMAGAMIALWDTGKSSHDLLALMNGSYVYAKTTEELERLANEEAAMAEGEEASDAGDTDTDEEGKSNEAGDKGGLQVVNEVSEEDRGSVSEDETVSAESEGIDVVEEAHDDTEAALAGTSQINVYVDPNVNYPIPYGSVDESYFNDALFIGDSRLQGFGMYSGLPGTFYAATSFQLFKYETMGVVNTGSGKVPIFDALPYDTFTKIYIKVGLNEMGGNDDAFISKYVELITRLRESEPRAIIYIHGVLPVTASKSRTDKVHNNAHVNARNEMLRQLAIDQKAYYLDVGSALAGADRSLPEEMAADGIHLKSQYMGIWKEYLLSHAVTVEQ